MNYYDAEFPMTFVANQFHFHAPSEHTINGEYMDLEMHTVHYPASSGGMKDSADAPDQTFIAAALGINFSVEKFTADLSESEIMIIDNFFESLRWDVVVGGPP